MVESTANEISKDATKEALVEDETVEKEGNNKELSPMEEKLLSILKDKGPLTRDQLVIEIDTPRTTIFDWLKRLIKKNLVKKTPFYPEKAERGRPKVLFLVT